MSWHSRFTGGLRALFRRRRVEQDLDDELRGYLEAAADAHIRAGMSPDEAHRAARVALGSPAAVKDWTRAVGWESVVDDLRQDLRYAGRTLLKTPGFALIAVGTLALGIGATAAIFTLVNALILRPLPFADPARLMLVHIVSRDHDTGEAFKIPWSYPKYRMFRDHQDAAFESSALFDGRDWSLTGAGEPERLRGEIVGAAYLSTLGVTPVAGRDFARAEDQTPGMNGIVMIGYGLWQRRFGGQTSVLGQSIGLNGAPYTIVGILPPDFRGLTGDAQLWVPLMTLTADRLDQKWMHSYYMVARRRATVSENQAAIAATRLGAEINAAFQQPDRPTDRDAAAESLNAARVDPLVERSTLVLFGVVTFVLLIGCVNLANLLLARSVTRQREVAMRMALGATGGRLLRQFLTESLLLASAGALSGIALAVVALRLAGALIPAADVVLSRHTLNLTKVGAGLIHVDMTTLLFALVTAMVTAVLFGLAPAWHASRVDIVRVIKTGGAGSMTPGLHGLRLRNVLIAGETTLALVLLVASGLMLQSVRNLQHTELGFRPDGIVTASVALPQSRYHESRMLQFFVDLQNRLRALPGVESVAVTNTVPVSGDQNSTTVWLPDKAPVPDSQAALIGVHWTSPDFFRTMGVRLLRGRLYSDRDSQSRPEVVVINETAARALFKGDNPIGRRIAMGFSQNSFSGDKGAEVIGVVNDVRYNAVEAEPASGAYVSVLQSPIEEAVILVRSKLDAAALAPAIRQEVSALDRDVPVSSIKTMRDQFGDATWRTRLSAELLGAFAAIALLLAAMGIYGVMTQAVAQRTREIGVRLALGASRQDVFALVIGRAMTIVLTGIAAGVAVSLLSMRFLAPLLYQVTPNDPAILAMLGLVLLVASLAASYLPARRATRVDPLTSLRAE